MICVATVRPVGIVYEEPLKGHEDGYSWQLAWLWGWYSVYYPYWFEGRPGQA